MPCSSRRAEAAGAAGCPLVRASDTFTRARAGGSGPLPQVIGLQRAIGNRAVTHMLGARLGSAPAPISARPLGAEGVVQRMAIGSGTPPVWGHGMTLSPVPATDLPRVNDAMAMVKEVATDQAGRPNCHDYFARNCTSHVSTAMLDTFNRTVIWKLNEPGGDANARGGPSGDVGYTQQGYDQGTYGLAGTIVHEMMHVCGIPGGDEHFKASVARAYCIGPGRNQFLIRAGPASGGVMPLVLLGYRRFLANWAAGRLQPYVGLDLNVSGLVSLGFPAGSSVVGGEFGSLTLGTKYRPAWPWGGERYGGLTLSAEAGPSAGTFRFRSPRPGEGGTSGVAAGVVLQAGLGAEFYIPDPLTEGQIITFSLEAAYRMVQPLNPQAERIHALVFSLGFPF
jgi:hypothetical protein